MKRPFEEAAELFPRCQDRQNHSADQSDGTDICRAFTLLAEGLRDLDKRLEKFEAAAEGGASGIFRGSSGKGRPRVIFAPTAPKP